jgi:catechol 2,3-dioxygenase-like lactoylglutathione lyase family enzyme
VRRATSIDEIVMLRILPIGVEARRMISGTHIVLFTDAVEATRDFLRDALHLPSVDAGGGWLIFALPPAEVAVHAADQPRHELYLMCDDLAVTMTRLGEAGATFGPVHVERWGRVTVMTMPGGAELPIYQPSHPSPNQT